MSPASTMKLVTTWSALNLLGPAYSWRTEVYATAPVVGGALDGTLVFRGGGDPTLVIENLWLLVQRLRDTGLRELRGDVLLDRSAFAPVTYDPDEFDGSGDRASGRRSQDPLCAWAFRRRAGSQGPLWHLPQ